MTANAKLVVAVTLGSSLLILGALPLVFLTLPDPLQAVSASPDRGGVGVYLRTGSRTFKLCPYRLRVRSFPRDALVAADRPHIYIKYRQLEPPSAYGLHLYPSGQSVAVDRRILSGPVLELVPVRPLRPGPCYIRSARDGMDGGTDYCYFRVINESSKGLNSPAPW